MDDKEDPLDDSNKIISEISGIKAKDPENTTMIPRRENSGIGVKHL